MRVRFLEDFDFKPTRATTIAYQAGMEVTVLKRCGEQAVAAGKAVELPKPPRETSGGADGEQENDG
ncbi:hypothetical protein GOZ78_03240 [Agrobacterium vitis]|uniref:Uncharacterized protein n=1 Tax=Agrobacterium vitis TaxID=373 RepID=A0ABD6G6W4_AGRVI|nr:hypothetical protein [Agrobacterium vitis]MUO77913.1 hypothetical protein [Agrobacterium vitis]MUO93431.1 hypothetical protein [Agrobacterium vitis]MUP04782.1 hypothetical protein [Agrobacterium vitis]MVA09034.1 hypothetical protein [Agrobacterium vitis]MVA93088.1 hypothetical protein [Agrobacterium vitis]